MNRMMVLIMLPLLVMAAPVDVFGRYDTVGATFYDDQAAGPAGHFCYYDPGFGTHVTWMWSAESSSYWDRSMRYNFHDNISWRHNLGPELIDWGCNAFVVRNGYGSLDVHPGTHCAYISTHSAYSSRHVPLVSRDLAPGSGVFETESASTAGIVDLYFPACGLTASGRVHLGLFDYPGRISLIYTSLTGSVWRYPPLSVGDPEPGFTNYGIATSHRSNRVCFAWNLEWLDPQHTGWYRLSEDDGETWGLPESLPFPPAFRPVPGETLGPSFHGSSLYPFFDLEDNLHLAASVYCILTETTYDYGTAQVWHWSEAAGWSQVVRVDAETSSGWVGYGAIAATRPSLAGGTGGELVCVWEQFDPHNVEPLTMRQRADIWGAISGDNGRTWTAPLRLTESNQTSKRFPSLSPVFKADSFVYSFTDDLVAGNAVNSESPTTLNPVIVNTCPLSLLGVAERPLGRAPRGLELTATPNPFRSGVVLTFDLSRSGPVRLLVSDAAGRIVRTLVEEDHAAGSHLVRWAAAAPGVYFATLETDSGRRTRRLIALR